MPAFKDANGREWLVKVDVPKIREVRDEVDFNLTANDGNLYAQLSEDYELLVNILWVLCRGQHDGVTDKQFGEALVGDPIEHATNALVEAVANFFPTRKASLLRSLVAKQTNLMNQGLEMAATKLNDDRLMTNSLANMEAAMDREMDQLLTGATGANPSAANSASESKD